MTRPTVKVLKSKFLTEGVWEEPVMKGYRLGCCDCRRVHKVDFRIRKGQVQFRVWHDRASTRMARRLKKSVWVKR